MCFHLPALVLQLLRARSGTSTPAEIAASGGAVCTISAHTTDLERLKNKAMKLTAENKELKDALARFSSASAVRLPPVVTAPVVTAPVIPYRYDMCTFRRVAFGFRQLTTSAVLFLTLVLAIALMERVC